MATGRTFELRTYHAAPGKVAELHARFRDHTLQLFAKHDMEVVAFFNTTDDPSAGDTLVYLMAYPDRASADASWEAFRADPEWIAAKSASEINGPLVAQLESVFLSPTDYSPLS